MIKKTKTVVFLNILIVCCIVFISSLGRAQDTVFEQPEAASDSIIQEEPELSQDISDDGEESSDTDEIADSEDQQEKITDTTTDNRKVEEDAASESEAAVEKPVASNAPAAKVNKQRTEAKKVTSKTESTSSTVDNARLTILDITNNNLKHKRIPELKVSEQNQDIARLDSKQQTSDAKTKDGSKDKGFLSVKPNKGWIDEWGPKIALLVIVIAMFILYRLKSRKKRRKIFRKIPKR